MNYLFKSLRLFEKLKNLEGQRGVSNNIGSYFEKQGNIPKALEYYYKCLKIDELTNDSLGLANSYNILGSVAKKENELKNALTFYSKTKTIAETLAHPYYLATSLNNIANVYLIQFEEDSILRNDSTLLKNALSNYQKSLSLFKEMNNRYGVAAATYKIGTVAFVKKEYEKAKCLFKESRDQFKSINNKLSESMALEQLAKTELLLKDFSQAEQNELTSLKIAQEIKYPTYIQNSAETLSEIYSEIG